MIRVVWGRDRVTLRGHAGYAPAGQDIVCAAVAAVVFALAGALEQQDAVEELTIRPGLVILAARPGHEPELQVLRSGLGQLAGRYPGCIRLEE